MSTIAELKPCPFCGHQGKSLPEQDATFDVFPPEYVRHLDESLAEMDANFRAARGQHSVALDALTIAMFPGLDIDAIHAKKTL